jgi:hypothetical protein
VANEQSASEVGIPAVTEACADRWSEHTGLDGTALDQVLADPEREVVERPPRWSGLTPSPEQRFLVTGGGEAVFVLVANEGGGPEYTAISCVIRNRSVLAQKLPPPQARRRLVPLGLAVVAVVVIALVGVGIYALLSGDGGGSPTPTDTTPKPARELVAASFAAQRAPALRAGELGRVRVVHHSRGSVPREVCGAVRRRGRAVGQFCAEVAEGRVVSTWFVPRGKPDRERFRRLCAGLARAQDRCPA